MKRSTRLFAMLLSIVMVLSLVACGGSAKDTPTAEKAPEQSQTAPQEQAPAESSWPSGTVTLYVPAKAGGTTDGISRMLAENWGAYTGQSFVVVNDTTGNGTVPCETVRNSDLDGLNLLLYNTSWCSLVSTGGYAQTLDDFTILGCICEAAPESTCILVQADSPFQTMEDLVAYAQANPGDLICGGQINSRGHFVEILVEDALDFSTTYVDAGSNADTITALLGGNIDMCCITTPGGAPYVESGDLRALSVNGADKSLLMPDVPRLVDMGHEAIDLPMVHFLFGPKGMAEEDINAISEMLKQTLDDTELVNKIETAGNYMMYLTPAESEELMRSVQSDFDKAYGIIQTLQ